MSLCGLLLIVPFVMADTYDFTNESLCLRNLPCYDYEAEPNYPENFDWDIQHNSSLSECEDSSSPESFCDLSCSTYKSNLTCSWSTRTLPKDAQYSAFVYLCQDGMNLTVQHLQCSSNSERERVECYGQIFEFTHVLVQVYIVTPIQRHLLCDTYPKEDIEILEPPQIITALIKSQYLEIEWSENSQKTPIDCFDYELKINNNTVQLNGHLKYVKPNIDLTRSYSIQIRTKWNVCASNNQWSDWSEVKVVNPTEKPYQLNAYVIASIAFVLPMILLAFLLVCKFQRLSEKLFPSIPSPSVKVKMLLEKDDFTQAMPPKQYTFDAEEGTQILQVTS